VKRPRILNAEPRKVCREERNAPSTPSIMHEYQKKRLTEFASRKWLILKDMLWVLREEIEPKTQPQNEEKQEQDPGLQMELSTISIIPRCKEESLRILQPCRLPS
jgi:hypothetical protein